MLIVSESAMRMPLNGCAVKNFGFLSNTLPLLFGRINKQHHVTFYAIFLKNWGTPVTHLARDGYLQYTYCLLIRDLSY